MPKLSKAERNAAARARTAAKRALLASSADTTPKPEAGTDTPATAEATTEAPKPGKATKKAGPVLHTVARSYGGSSPTFNSGYSKTALRLDIGAGSYTYRDDCFIRDLIAAYSGNAFARGNADAGNIRRSASHGFLAVLSDGTLQATAEALTYCLHSKPLQAGDKLKPADLQAVLKRAEANQPEA